MLVQCLGFRDSTPACQTENLDMRPARILFGGFDAIRAQMRFEGTPNRGNILEFLVGNEGIRTLTYIPFKGLYGASLSLIPFKNQPVLLGSEPSVRHPAPSRSEPPE